MRESSIASTPIPTYRQYPPTWFNDISYYEVIPLIQGRHVDQPKTRIIIHYRSWWRLRRVFTFHNVKTAVIEQGGGRYQVHSSASPEAATLVRALTEWMEHSR